MSYRHSWTLILIAGVLVGYAWLFKNPFSENRATADRRLFPELAATAVTSLEIRQADLQIRLAQTNETWHLVHPIHYPAEAPKVQALVADLLQLEYQSQVDTSTAPPHDGQELYGFDNSNRSLTVATDTASLQLDIGDTEGAGNIAFVRRSDQDNIYTIQADSLDRFKLEVDYWRDPRVFPHPVSQISELKIEGTETVHLTRETSGEEWKMIKPVPNARLDQSFVSFFLQELAELRVGSFEAAIESERQAVLEFKLSNELDYSIELLGPSPTNPTLHRVRLVAMDTPALIATAFVNQVLETATTFRNPYLLDQDFKFDQITVQAEETFTLAIDNESQRWTLTEPFQFPADNRLVAQFVRQLTELRINKFIADGIVDEIGFGLDFPFRTITFSRSALDFTTPEITEVLKIRFGLKIQNNLMTHRSDEAAVYAVPFGAVTHLPAYAFQLRDRKLWNIATDNITKLKITLPDQSTKIWVRDGTTWQNDDVSLGQIEAATLNSHLEELSNVLVESWTSRPPTTSGHYGIGKRAQVEIEIAEGDQTNVKTLKFGSISPRGHRYAETDVAGIPTVFEFPGKLYAKLNPVFGLEAHNP
ncbi:MAG: hypothetical protein M2R45_02489 [Verrucomicrobia subdivision 3 bacterium]|nr:hypothetical protein [Limisphaerales bacterium]MCS1413279.1 hypothetical protein [Limisphaerales bacterium]